MARFNLNNGQGKFLDINDLKKDKEIQKNVIYLWESIIQKMDTGPWNLSTIEPDIGRVPLEIGACTR
jgi:hypothetical protein